VRGTHRPRTGYFLRAESFFNVATYVEELHHPGAAAARGGISLHERSHGESFIALFSNRFGPKGLYILSEHGIAETPYEKTDVVESTRSFLHNREQFLHHLFED
jgi:predicted ATPase